MSVHTSIVLDVFECVVHESPLTAIVAVVTATVHQILLRQAGQSTGLTEGLSLQGTSLKMTWNHLSHIWVASLMLKGMFEGVDIRQTEHSVCPFTTMALNNLVTKQVPLCHRVEDGGQSYKKGTKVSLF